MVHCVLLALANQKERRHRLIILRVWNIISTKFILFSMHSLCLMQDAKSRRNVLALKGIF